MQILNITLFRCAIFIIYISNKYLHDGNLVEGKQGFKTSLIKFWHPPICNLHLHLFSKLHDRTKNSLSEISVLS